MKWEKNVSIWQQGSGIDIYLELWRRCAILYVFLMQVLYYRIFLISSTLFCRFYKSIKNDLPHKGLISTLCIQNTLSDLQNCKPSASPVKNLISTVNRLERHHDIYKRTCRKSRALSLATCSGNQVINNQHIHITRVCLATESPEIASCFGIKIIQREATMHYYLVT